jgi:hypothetical protein
LFDTLGSGGFRDCRAFLLTDFSRLLPTSEHNINSLSVRPAAGEVSNLASSGGTLL